MKVLWADTVRSMKQQPMAILRYKKKEVPLANVLGYGFPAQLPREVREIVAQTLLQSCRGGCEFSDHLA